MGRRLALFAALALMLFAFGGTSAASAAEASAKSCKGKKALLKTKSGTKCVKRCPKGYEKKRVRGKRRCVKQRPPEEQGGDPNPDNGGTTDPGGDTTDPGGDTTDPGPQQPAFDPAAQFADIMSRMYLLRTYQVPKPGQHSGYNTHSESYGFCNDSTNGQRARHYYEGIAYIYDTNGPWSVIDGTASEDGSTGSGTIQYTQQNANFNEEVGKVQTIQIEWQGDVATVAHPEIGTNNFAKSVSSSSSCTRAE